MSEDEKVDVTYQMLNDAYKQVSERYPGEAHPLFWLVIRAWLNMAVGEERTAKSLNQRGRQELFKLLNYDWSSLIEWGVVDTRPKTRLTTEVFPTTASGRLEGSQLEI